MNEPAPTTEPDAQPQAVTVQAPGSRLQAWQLIVAALIATGLAWPFLKRYEKAFPMENLSVEMTNRIRARADDPIAWGKERQNQWEALSRNAGLNLGIFGLCLGSCLAATVALVRGETFFKKFEILAYGVVLGTVGGVLGGQMGAVVALYLRKEHEMDVTFRAALIHAAGWIVPGLICGVILNIASRRRQLWELAFGGLMGGLAAAIFYEPIAATLFQLDRTDIPIPEGTGNKFLFLSVGAVMMTIGAWSASVLPATRSQPPRA